MFNASLNNFSRSPYKSTEVCDQTYETERSYVEFNCATYFRKRASPFDLLNTVRKFLECAFGQFADSISDD